MSDIRATMLAARDFRRTLLASTITRVHAEQQGPTGQFTALRFDLAASEPLIIAPVLLGQSRPALPGALTLTERSRGLAPADFAEALRGLRLRGVSVRGNSATLAARNVRLELPDGRTFVVNAADGAGAHSGLWFFDVLAASAPRSSVGLPELIGVTVTELVTRAARNPAAAPNTLDRYAPDTGALLDGRSIPIDSTDHDAQAPSNDPQVLGLAHEYFARGDSLVANGILHFPAYMLALQKIVDLINSYQRDEAEALMDEWRVGYEDDPSLVAEFGYRWVLWDRDSGEWVASDEGLI